MRRRASLLLLLLALGAVCLLLWETVVAPGLGSGDGGEAASILDEEGLLGSTAEAEGDVAPGLTGRAAPGTASAGPDGRGALAHGPDGGGTGPGPAGDASVPFQGKVLGPDGAPARGVEIVMRGPGGTETLETDANGAFAHAMRPGRYQLLFRSEAGSLLLRSWMLDGSPKDDLEFALREPGAIRVSVKRGEEAVPGADILVVSRDMGDLLTFEAATDYAGMAAFEGLVPGRYRVTVQVPDGPLARHDTHASPALTREVKMRVPEGVVLKGTVRAGADGPGVGGAAILLTTQAKASHGVFETTFETNPDGTYELMVPQGRARDFRIEAEGFAPWPDVKQRNQVLRSLRNLARKGPVVRNASLRGGASLGGLVQTAEKEPIPGVKLQFSMRRGPSASATSGADGSYEVPNLGPGTYDLKVETPSYFPVTGQALRVAIPGGASPKPVAFDVTLAGARRLSGIVVDGAGQGVGGARVWIMGGGRVVRSARDAGRELEVFSGVDGRWVIADIPPDKNVTVRASMGELEADPVPAPWERPPPQPLRLTLQGTATVRGTVIDVATRAPLARVRVRIVPTPWGGRSSRTVWTNARGEFSAGHLLPGTYKLTPSLRDYLIAEPETVELVRDGERSVGLRLDPGEIFAGTVVDEAGAPLRYARVRVVGQPDNSEKSIRRAVNTGTQGEFRMTGFRQGTYTLTASRNGFRADVVRNLRGGHENLRFILKKR